MNKHKSVGSALAGFALLVGVTGGDAGWCADAKPAQVADGDWPKLGRTLAGTRFSPLAQINRDNVAKLKQIWSQPAGSQAVPLVIGGVMYTTTPRGAASYDGATGQVLWNYEMTGGRPTQRGLAYWPGVGAQGPRLLFTAGNRVVALDASTGKPVEGFGTDGSVDVGVGYGSPPIIFKNLFFIGANTGEASYGTPGNPRAFDVLTGAKVWEFHSVPQPGEVGHETWLDEGWKNRSGTNVWAFSMTVDEERGLLYMPISGASPNYWGGDRPGDNLFANSIVAVDAATGAYRWHFQTSHHDVWDSDEPAPPVLFDLKKDGKTIPALAVVGKTSYLFILNRETGKPIHEVEERPVPMGDAPQEWYSTTQPFPVTPPLSRVRFSKDELVTAADTTPEHAKACQDLWDRSGGFYNAGPFTPFNFKEHDAPPKTTVQFPGGNGGSNWGGPAVDPTTGYIYVNAIDTSLVGWVELKKPGGNYGRGTEGATQPYDRASVDGPGPYAGLSARVPAPGGAAPAAGGPPGAGPAGGPGGASWPCQRPPWAQLVAVDANTGEIAWRQVLGIYENLPEGKQLVGNSSSAGPTATAGGLVFIGATNDRRVRAFDARSGKLLWETVLERASAIANPMSFLGKDGKQYVGIVARDQLMVYGLQ